MKVDREKLGRIRMSLKARNREYRKRKFHEFEKIAGQLIDGGIPSEEDVQKVNRYNNPPLIAQNEVIKLFAIDLVTFKSRAESCNLPVACAFRPSLRREHFIYPLPGVLEHAEDLATPRYKGPYPGY